MSSSSLDASGGPASADPVFEGMFGPYAITAADRREVLSYRLALLLLAIAQLGLILQAWLVGSQMLWPWLLPMALGLGLALRWIHIYLVILHRALQLLWLLGCLGFAALAWHAGPTGMAAAVVEEGRWVWLVGPFFAALAGIGFKEFFCFRRLEAIGVTLLLPVALLGHLSGVLSPGTCAGLLTLQAVLLLVLCLRKFPMPAAADVGDKSVFDHLKRQAALRRA